MAARDIFSLGVVFYELLAGTAAVSGRIDSGTAGADHELSRPARPGKSTTHIPKELERICLKALSKRASERYTTAKDMADDLRHFLAERHPSRRSPRCNGLDAGATMPSPFDAALRLRRRQPTSDQPAHQDRAERLAVL